MNSMIINQDGSSVTAAAAAPLTMAERIAAGTRHTVTEEFKVDAFAGSRDGRVSSEWSCRPDDQRFMSLGELLAYVTQRSANAQTQIVETRDIKLVSDRSDLSKLAISTRDGNGKESILTPTHWSFGQLCQLSQSPAGYLRELPAPIAAIPLQYRLQNVRENVKTYFRPESGELMAVNGPDYGRVKDLALVQEVMRITEGNDFKIPGMMDWNKGTYNPFVNPTRDSTTLYASDHDVFMFLCDDTHPIEIGKTAKGDPDLLFPGFYAWNSETGAGTLGADFFYLRGVCMNRNLWGVEESTRISIRHSKNAPHRFGAEVKPQLLQFVNSQVAPVIAKVGNAREAIVARDDDERVEFLAKQKFSKRAVADILAAHLNEEERPAESVWDMVQAITAHARTIQHSDTRRDMEMQAGKLMARV